MLTESGPADRLPRGPPEAPLPFKAYDGKASFDGQTVRFRWFWTGASSAKWKAGDQSFPVAELSGVEWRSPEVVRGVPAAAAAGTRGAARAGQADQDPAAVVFGLGYGPVHESLPFAAAVLAAVRTSAGAPCRRSRRRRPGGIPRISPSGSGTSGSCIRPDW